MDNTKFRGSIDTLNDLIRLQKAFTEQNDGPNETQVTWPGGNSLDFGVRRPLLSISILPLVTVGRKWWEENRGKVSIGKKK